MSNMIFILQGDDSKRWIEALIPAMPEVDFNADCYIWPDVPDDPDSVDVAVVWRPNPGALKTFPNLKAVINLGAGVDSILADDTYPQGVPLARMIDPAMTRHMTEFVIYKVLHFHRKFHIYEEMQRHHVWKELSQLDTLTRTVGILGLGALGSDAASHLTALEFKVAGWSRTEKNLDGVESFFGADGLTPFLAQTDILVCLLPLTQETRGILNADLFSKLPQGAFVINAARGGHMIEADMLAALDSGHIEAAALDVFPEEPLPDASPFWDHPKVWLTPHIASLSVPSSAAAEIADNIRRVRAGKPPKDRVNMDSGY
ncbi:MAG: glyoxylate/hydroxypyruvate reductase A [Rhodospirillaceae bacterium]|nr:glyoxylate/hydroxypyruvate reductase A [Rhodospirillaceae bacterium]